MSDWDTNHSPFAPIIGTNYIPTAAELNRLKAILVHPVNKLASLELDIDHTQATLDALLRERQIVKSYVDAHRALLSPVRQIPAETLAEIFAQCLPSDPPYGLRDLTKAPLLLTTICKDWRHVALTTPRLWKSLHVYLPISMTAGACAKRIRGVIAWLERSGSLPLSISIHRSLHGKSDSNTAPNQENLLRSVMKFSHRFENVYLSLSSSILSIFGELAPPTFPILASLRLRDLGVDNPMRGRCSLTLSEASKDTAAAANFALLRLLFPRMPGLHAVSLQLSVEAIKYLMLPCNWKHLTSLDLSSPMHPDQARNVLAQVPQMRTLALTIEICQDCKDQATVHLNNLSKLQLSLAPRMMLGQNVLKSDFLSMFGRIHCPVLQSLSVSCPPMITVVSKLMFTSLPLDMLEELELDMATTSEMLTECLSLIPNLTSFKFTDSTYQTGEDTPLQDSHIVSLTSSPSNPTPCWPRLESIQISSISAQEACSDLLTSAALTEFLDSRAQSPLKSCHILFQNQPSFSKMELDILRSLGKNGLDLRFSYMDIPSTDHEPDPPDLGLFPVISQSMTLDDSVGDAHAIDTSKPKGTLQRK
ncbi:hypothetical protein BDP27DRAFT_212144 [Rhodocollybia butyracea]|uniref:F-box domain-containing protein n=1 Tax=Rhodocollybia butyracea TaxID=206335 RepID=A0A9P5U1M9_9AGAR|nr:hypothetical protein BDP27DRAFT_212144 [Rhodocollybia butyracea]